MQAAHDGPDPKLWSHGSCVSKGSIVTGRTAGPFDHFTARDEPRKPLSNARLVNPATPEKTGEDQPNSYSRTPAIISKFRPVSPPVITQPVGTFALSANLRVSINDAA
jgi:hypothetical protein